MNKKSSIDMINWKEFKEKKYRKYEEAKRKGDIDREIVPLLDLINSKREFVTLSSCSGRIAVIDMPEFGDKLNSKFLGKWHGEVDAREVIEAIRRGMETTWLIAYPPIIHVACESLEVAEKLMNIANNAGFRRSGIISLKKFIVEVSSLERLEMPVAINSNLLFDEKTIEIIVKFANEKLLRGREKLDKFEDMVKLV